MRAAHCEGRRALPHLTDRQYYTLCSYYSRAVSRSYMCREWQDDRTAFMLYVSELPGCFTGLVLSRVDRRRGFEPGNLRFATRSESCVGVPRRHTSFTSRWRDARIRAGRTMRSVAEEVGVHPWTVARFEMGMTQRSDLHAVYTRMMHA